MVRSSSEIARKRSASTVMASATGRAAREGRTSALSPPGGEWVNRRGGTLSRRRRFPIRGSEDTGGAKGGDAIGRVRKKVTQELVGMLAERGRRPGSGQGAVG